MVGSCDERGMCGRWNDSCDGRGLGGRRKGPGLLVWCRAGVAIMGGIALVDDWGRLTRDGIVLGMGEADVDRVRRVFGVDCSFIVHIGLDWCWWDEKWPLSAENANDETRQ